MICTGGEESRRRSIHTSGLSKHDSSEVRVVLGGKGLGKLPGAKAKLLRGLWWLVVQRSGVCTVAQSSARQWRGGARGRWRSRVRWWLQDGAVRRRRGSRAT